MEVGVDSRAVKGTNMDRGFPQGWVTLTVLGFETGSH